MLEFNNDAEGFQKAKDWSVDLAAVHGKKQIVLGLEPTGHYWFCLAAWMVSNGISVVQVNPYAVKQTKEVEDNSQLKDDIHKLAIDELEAFDYKAYKANGFKVEHVGDYPLQLETKPE